MNMNNIEIVTVDLGDGLGTVQMQVVASEPRSDESGSLSGEVVDLGTVFKFEQVLDQLEKFARALGKTMHRVGVKRG
ncbi:hypothetical protein HC928_16370, partial [bacterium]|nr:hypothetical protein [bacterium]